MIGFLLWRHRRAQKKYGGDTGSIAFSWKGTLSRSRSILGIAPSTAKVRSSSEPYDQSWAIDDFDERTLETSDFRGGHEWLASSPISPTQPKSTAQRIQEYVKPSRGFFRNPFKGRPIQVVSTQARRGFRVDDSDQSTQYAGSRRPTLDTLNSTTFDHRDEALDESSVLLISRTPGVDFRSNASHADHHSEVHVDVVPPSRPISYDYGLPQSYPQSPSTPTPSQFPPPPSQFQSPYSAPALPSSPNLSHHTLDHYQSHPHNRSVESIIRPPKTDPTMLFPASVRSAGYTGVPNPGMHSRSVSAESLLSTSTPMTH